MLELTSLGVTRGGTQVLDAIDLKITPGEVVGLIGPNGAGKTTLMRAALGLQAHSGTSSLDALGAGARARAAAYLPQTREVAWPLPVEDVVALARNAHPGAGATADRQAVNAAIAQMGLESFRHRAVTSLSGGEQARVMLARVLAQETPLILADEPAAGLDPEAQIVAMETFAAHARAGGAVLVTMHDLGLAAQHCTRLVLLERGQLRLDGAPQEVLSAPELARAFGIRLHMAEGPDGLIVQPVGRL